MLGKAGFGQDYYEWDPGMWENWSMDYSDYSDWYTPGEPAVDEYPSETRYVTQYQEQQAALQAQVSSGSDFLSILKSILTIATPLATTLLTKTTTPPVTAPKTILPTTASLASIGSIFSGITSNIPLLAGIGVGAYFLLRRRGNGKSYRRKNRRRKR